MSQKKARLSAQLKIPDDEYRLRFDRLLDFLEHEQLDGAVLFDQYYILYYTGFAFIPTERPIALVINTNGSSVLFVPRLELEHALLNTHVERVDYYLEYPHETHPMSILKNTLKNLKIQGRIGVDYDGYPWIFGYRGPSLSELCNCPSIRIAGFIEEQMMLKSDMELGLIRESVKWGHLAHVLLQRYTEVGATETEVSRKASMQADLTMLDAIGPIYKAQNPFSEGASAGYRGQIGRQGAIPHSLANNITFQAGDVLVSGAGAPVWGYNSELERTLIIGTATEEQERLFNHMVALQEIAFEAIRPGVACAQVDLAVRNYYEKHGLMKYWKHHVGHAIGLRYHESPFLDLGDQTIIQPGMVFTVEPGLYDPEIGGFRHSDTVVVTKTGVDIMTYYPRDLVNLTIPA